jgi:glycosyltransferase involved in cell wall biosynthesis
MMRKRRSRQLRLVLQQTALADYRVPVVEAIRAHGVDLAVCCGRDYFDPTVTITSEIAGPLVLCDNLFFARRRLAWQRGAVLCVVRADRAIIEANPRLLSNWAILLLRRMLGKPTVIWGHPWPRAGEGTRSDAVRHQMRRLATTILVYTETGREQLASRMPGKRILAAPNALYPRSETGDAPRDTSPAHFVYVGRLVASKKPLLLIDAFLRAIERGLDEDCRLIVVGDGPEMVAARSLAQSSQAAGRVELRGRVAPGSVRGFYERAIASVSPGYVGLSITQSLSYGVPMIFARDEPHAPEIEAARVGFNAVEVPSDDSEALADALISVARDRDRWGRARVAIAADCAARYSLDVMVARLLEAASV